MTRAAAGPAEGAYRPTLSNTVDLPIKSAAILVGVGGDIKVTTEKGEEVVIPLVPAGIFPIEVTRIWVTGTTATSLTVLY